MQQGFTSDSGFDKLLTDDGVLKLISTSDLTEFVRQWVSTVHNSTVHNSVQHRWNKLLGKVEEDWKGKRYGDQTTTAEEQCFFCGDERECPKKIHKERQGIEKPTAELPPTSDVDRHEIPAHPPSLFMSSVSTSPTSTMRAQTSVPVPPAVFSVVGLAQGVTF